MILPGCTLWLSIDINEGIGALARQRGGGIPVLYGMASWKFQSYLYFNARFSLLPLSSLVLYNNNEKEHLRIVCQDYLQNMLILSLS